LPASEISIMKMQNWDTPMQCLYFFLAPLG
jgi:hypothetical protein